MNCWKYACEMNHLMSSVSQFFCLRNNTKPKQESFEFKPPQGPPPQPPTQVSAQVRRAFRSSVHLSRHSCINPFHVSIEHPSNPTLHPVNFLPASTFVFSYIHLAVLAPTDPFILCPSMHHPIHPPTSPRTNKVPFYSFICVFMSTCRCYRSLGITESLSAFKVTPQSTVLAAELICRCGDGSHR